MMATLGVLALVFVAVTALVWTGRGDAPPPAESAASNASDLLRTRPPWPPRQAGLEQAVAEAGFPPVGDESYHVHALLSVFTNGEQVPVPPNIGIDTTTGYHSPLHTHTPDGVIHFEARLAINVHTWSVLHDVGCGLR